MRSATVISLVALVALVTHPHAKELELNHAADAQDVMNSLVVNLVGKLVNRAFKAWPLYTASLENTTLGKPRHTGFSVVTKHSPGIRYVPSGYTKLLSRAEGSQGSQVIARAEVDYGKLRWSLPGGKTRNKIKVSLEGKQTLTLSVWPGALMITELFSVMPAKRFANLNVLEVGAGQGLPSLAAAARGARVKATDINKKDLQILVDASKQQQIDVETGVFDIYSEEKLPAADLVIFSNVMPSTDIALAAASRVGEAVNRGSWVIVGDTGITSRARRSQFLNKVQSIIHEGRPDLKPEFEEVEVNALRSINWPKNKGSAGLIQWNEPSDMI